MTPAAGQAGAVRHALARALQAFPTSTAPAPRAILKQAGQPAAAARSTHEHTTPLLAIPSSVSDPPAPQACSLAMIAWSSARSRAGQPAPAIFYTHQRVRSRICQCLPIPHTSRDTRRAGPRRAKASSGSSDEAAEKARRCARGNAAGLGGSSSSSSGGGGGGVFLRGVVKPSSAAFVWFFTQHAGGFIDCRARLSGGVTCSSSCSSAGPARTCDVPAG